MQVAQRRRQSAEAEFPAMQTAAAAASASRTFGDLAAPQPAQRDQHRPPAAEGAAADAMERRLQGKTIAPAQLRSDVQHTALFPVEKVRAELRTMHHEGLPHLQPAEGHAACCVICSSHLGGPAHPAVHTAVTVVDHQNDLPYRTSIA